MPCLKSRRSYFIVMRGVMKVRYSGYGYIQKFIEVIEDSDDGEKEFVKSSDLQKKSQGKHNIDCKLPKDIAKTLLLNGCVEIDYLLFDDCDEEKEIKVFNHAPIDKNNALFFITSKNGERCSIRLDKNESNYVDLDTGYSVRLLPEESVASQPYPPCEQKKIAPSENKTSTNPQTKGAGEIMALTSDDELNESERKTLLKLVIGMAIDSYGYDPNSKRNAATGSNKASISSRLQTRGINVSDDTMRKYLTEAKDLL